MGGKWDGGGLPEQRRTGGGVKVRTPVPLKLMVDDLENIKCEARSWLGPLGGGSTVHIRATSRLWRLLAENDTQMYVKFETPAGPKVVDATFVHAGIVVPKFSIDGVVEDPSDKRSKFPVEVGEVRCISPFGGADGDYPEGGRAAVRISFNKQEFSKNHLSAIVFEYQRPLTVCGMVPTHVAMDTRCGTTVALHLKDAWLRPTSDDTRALFDLKVRLSSGTTKYGGAASSTTVNATLKPYTPRKAADGGDPDGDEYGLSMDVDATGVGFGKTDLGGFGRPATFALKVPAAAEAFWGNSDNDKNLVEGGVITFKAPQWKASQYVEIEVSYNGGVDFVPAKRHVKYFDQPTDIEFISPDCGHLKGGATIHLTFPKLEDLKAKAAVQAAAKAGNTAYIPPSQRVTNTQNAPYGFNYKDIRVVFQFVPKGTRTINQLRNVTEVDKSCDVMVGTFKVGTDGVIPAPGAYQPDVNEGGQFINGTLIHGKVTSHGPSSGGSIDDNGGAFRIPIEARRLDQKKGEEEVLVQEYRFVECMVPYCRSNMKIANVLVSLNNYDLFGLSNYGWHAPSPPLPLRFSYYKPISFKRVGPSSAINDGGEPITITGSGFQQLGTFDMVKQEERFVYVEFVQMVAGQGALRIRESTSATPPKLSTPPRHPATPPPRHPDTSTRHHSTTSPRYHLATSLAHHT